MCLKKSEEDSDADKIKYPSEKAKAILTSSYFGAQHIWDLYKLTEGQ